MSVERRFTDGAHVARMLDGLETLPCAFCKTPCPVPEHVLAILQHRGQAVPLAVCLACSDLLLVVLPLFRAGLAPESAEQTTEGWTDERRRAYWDAIQRLRAESAGEGVDDDD